VQFNVIAIGLILVGLPIAVASITNTSGEITTDWSSHYDSNFDADIESFWVRNGGSDLSQTYENQNYGEGFCSTFAPAQETNMMIQPELSYDWIYPICDGMGWSTPFISTDQDGNPYNPYSTLNAYKGDQNTLNYTSTSVLSWLTGEPSLYMPQSHEALNYYHGTSGDGPFTWAFQNIDHFPTNETLVEQWRWTMIDPSTAYACDSAIFGNITFDYTIKVHSSWEYGPEHEIFQLSGSTTQLNSYETEVYDAQTGHWVQGCYVGVVIYHPFTAFEVLELQQAYEDAAIQGVTLTVDNLVVDAGFPIGTTALPWNGNDYFITSWEYATIDETAINFNVRAGTLLLAVLISGLAIASTPYWDPLRAYFKGRL
jgi:hypothetical protein